MRTRTAVAALALLLAAAMGAACEADGSDGAGTADTLGAGDAVATDRPVDFKLMVDRAALGEAFAAATTVAVSGSFSDGALLPAVDDGSADDDAAGDGVFTFRLSDHRAADDSLLHVGDQETFQVYVDGVAYADRDGRALEAGVTAWSTWKIRAVPGWEREVIVRLPRDDGAEQTAVVIGPE